MSFNETVSTFKDAGKPCILVSWNGDFITLGVLAAGTRRGGGEIGLSRLLSELRPLAG